MEAEGHLPPGPPDTATHVQELELLDAFLELSPDAAVVVDASGVIRAVNDQASSLFGYAPGELEGRPIEVLVPSRHREAHVAQRAAFSLTPQARPMGTGLDLHGQRKDGSEFPIDISLAPLTGEGGPGLVVAAVRDQTRWRQAQQELATAQAERHVLAERDRIARELHETVIDRLFAAGMGLQGLATQVSQPALSERLQHVINELDAAVRDIRASIFTPPQTPRR